MKYKNKLDTNGMVNYIKRSNKDNTKEYKLPDLEQNVLYYTFFLIKKRTS